MPPWLLSRQRNAWLFLLLALCGLMIALSVRNLYVIVSLRNPTPSYDIWGFLRSYAVHNGTLGLPLYFAQHNDHRIATSIPFFLADIRFTDASGYLCNTLQIVLMVFIAVALGRACSDRPAELLFISLSLFTALSSPVQWQNLSAPFQISFGFVNLFFIIAAFATLSACRRSGAALWGLSVMAAVSDGLSVFSLASGVLDGFVVAMIGAVVAPRSWAWRILLAAHVLWCFGFFWHYTFASDAIATKDISIIVPFSLMYLGSCLRGLDHLPVLLGSIDLVASVGAAVLAVRRKTDTALWLTLTVATAMMVGAVFTAFGRGGLGLGLYSATASRYTIQSIMMQFALGGFYVRYLNNKAAAAPIVLLFGAIAVATTFDQVSLDEWRDNVDKVAQAQAAIVKGSTSDDILSLLFPVPSLIRLPLSLMASHRLGPFSPRFGNLVTPPDYAFDMASRAGNLSVCQGAVGIKLQNDGQFFASGWVFSPQHPAERGSVAIVDRSSGAVITSGPQTVLRPDVAKAVPGAPLRSGFVVGAYYPVPITVGDMPVRIVLVPAAPDAVPCAIDATPRPERLTPG